MLHIGTDIVRIGRFKKWCSYTQEQLSHIFTPYEQAEFAGRSTAEFLASRFAVKEAAYKAYCSTGGNISFKAFAPQCGVQSLPTGQPIITCSLFNAESLSVSLSHDGDYAVAFVVYEAR